MGREGSRGVETKKEVCGLGVGVGGNNQELNKLQVKNYTPKARH